MFKLLIKNLLTKTDCVKVADPAAGRSLQIRHLDCGSCNGCDFELAALLNPLYDIQRYGFDFVASPRYADVLAVTGIVTRNLAEAARTTFAATPAPKLVVAIGDCAVDGGVFLTSPVPRGDAASGSVPQEGSTGFAVIGPVEKVLPVDLKIPGCPPAPQDILKALLTLNLRKKAATQDQ
jgi:Ni,Fe-hydrogenase III small subunit